MLDRVAHLPWAPCLHARATRLGRIAFYHEMVGAGLSRLAKVRLTTQTLINMAARSEFFRSYHLPVLSAEQNDSKSEDLCPCRKLK